MGGMVLLECGSNSLKVHFRTGVSGDIQCLKFPWRLGRDVCETGSLSDETVSRAVRTVEDLVGMGFERRSLLAIATEGLRDARNRADVLAQLRDRWEIPVRVISGREEASLLAEGYLKLGGATPAYLMDIGGGSVQLVHLSAERTILRDSLPLGAIRLQCLGEEEGKPWNRKFVEDHIEEQLEAACVMQTSRIHATGGTVKAVARVAEKKIIPRSEIDALLERVAADGPPPILKAERRAVFLPGLLLLAKLMGHTGAEDVQQLSISVGRTLLERLLERVGKRAAGPQKEVVLDHMRITNIWRRV